MYMPVVSLWVRLMVDGETDRLGNRIKSYAEPVQVHGCLFAPSAPADIATSRPDGARVSAVAHFPVGTHIELTEALISLDGKRYYHVVGEPVAFPEIASRGRWNMQVLLERFDG